MAPLIGEYERTSTVVADAYVKPRVRQYLYALIDQLRALGFEHELNVMLSSGGTTSAAVATTYGKGRIVLFGFRPQHRGQTHATFPMIFDALYWQ